MVFPWCLDRIGHGNVQRVLAMASYLSRHGVAVDLLYQGNPRVPSREHEFTGFRRVIRVAGWKSHNDDQIASDLAAYYSGYEPPSPQFEPGTALTAAVRGLVDALEYSAVIASYAWTAPIFESLSPRTLRIVDLHDVISVHGSRCQQATGKPSPFSLPEQTEQFLWRQWDVVLAITDDEADIVAQALRPTQQLLTVPHAATVVDTGEPASDLVVYTGSGNPSNEAAVRWLLSEVWPRVLEARPHSRLRLTGLICDAIEDDPLASTPGVELAGFVERPLDELARAAVSVAPYLYGSGLKIKVVEAAAAGRAIVTTAAGAAGTGLRHGTHLLVEDDAADFAAAIVRLLDDRGLRDSLAAAALDHMRLTFNDDACYGPVLDLLRTRTGAAGPAVIPRSVEVRILTALNELGGPPVVVWGNGSHTRALVASLRRLDARIRCIVDKGASVASVSPEHLPVIPARDFEARRDELILLSSQMYESEMWNDLAHIRAQGTHALALYRRDLVTDALKHRLFKGHRNDWPASSSATRHRPRGARLVIAEPSAGRSRGPFFRLARALQPAAAARGLQVTVAGSLRLSLDGFEPGDRDLWEPAFEFAHWDALRESDGDIWRVAARFARVLDSDLRRLTERLTLSGDDVMLFDMANLIDVIGVANWLDSRASATLPEVRLLFHFLPVQEAQWLNVTETEVRHAYILALALLEDRAGRRLRLLAQNDALARVLEDTFDRPVQAMGFPVTRKIDTPGDAVPAWPPRLLYAGEARADKGFGLLPGIADALANELNAGAIRLVCQSMRNEFADDRIVNAAQALTSRPGVEVIDRFLPSQEYDDLITGCDLILLPYDAEQYRARLSAVLVEAACAGLPAIVPARTWLSDQIEQGLGAGVSFDALDAASIADAIRRALSSLPSLKRDARAAASRARQQHDPRVVLDTILGRRAAAETTASIPA